ncbi:MAG: hypothetical protein GY929_16995, partial [Actinomycetia bacterium]|nr:hypothetical protein [Actinomycetes bacterium]
MPQHRYEGEALESLLTEVRAEHGPHAEIIEAEKIRLGGIAGFFSREGFALTVEVPEPIDSEPTAPTPIETQTEQAGDPIALGPAPEITRSRPGVPSIGDRSIIDHEPASGRILTGQATTGVHP